MKAIVNPLCPIWGGPVDLLLQRLLSEKRGTSIVAITDNNVHEKCGQIFKPVLDLFGVPLWVIPAGEQNKQLDTCKLLWQQMADAGLDRGSAVIAIGGGMITDLAGFVAACYMRGIPLISVPTTLLAQVDAALGGKTGVDLGTLKNYIGAFRQPEHIILDHRFLSTLPDRQIKNGLAEVIKHALLKGDEEWDFWKICPGLSTVDWETRIRSSARIKLAIAAQDPDEKGRRKLLNLGHTIGHAIESAGLESGADILHGEAVAAGLWCECWIAHERGNLGDQDWKTIQNCLEHFFPKISLEGMAPDRIIHYLRLDKKNSSGSIRMIRLDAPGKAEYDIELAVDEAMQSLQAYMR